MTQATRSRRGMLTRLLLVPCLILGPLIYVEWEQEADSPEVVAASDAPAAPASRLAIAPPDPGFVMPSLEEYNEVLARPPFSESRRPAPPGAMAKAVDQPLTATVVGTILAAGSVRALVEHGEPPVVTRVVVGQELDGWTVKTILQGKIVLVRSGTTVELKVKGGTSTASSEPASIPSPARPLASVGTQRLTNAGALSPAPSPLGNATLRRSQAGATAALAAAQGDAVPAQVVNSDLLPSPVTRPSRNSAKRR